MASMGAGKEERDRSPMQDGEQNGGRARDSRPRRDGRDGRDRRARDSRGSTGDRRGKPLRRVYVSNIPFDFPWQELKDLFRKEVGSVKFVEIFHDEKGTSRGCGIIEFDTEELVDAAIEKMHRYDLKSRKIVVKEDFGVERDRFGHIVRGGDSNNRRSTASDRPGLMGNFSADSRGGIASLIPPEQKYANTYGLNVSFLDSLGIEGPLVNRVFVANLDYKVDEEKLKEVFGLAGKVASVEINKDIEGKSKGHGVVTFDHPVEAVQAISMLNGQTYMDRRINVRMDRATERRDKEPRVSLPAGLKGIGHGLGANGVPLNDVATKINETAAPAAVPAPAPAVPAQLAGLGQMAGAGLMGAAPGAGFGAAVADMTAQLSAGGQLAQLGASGQLAQLGASGQLAQLGAGAQLAQLGAAASQMSQLGGGGQLSQLGGQLGASASLSSAGIRMPGSEDMGRGLDSGMSGRSMMDSGMSGRSMMDSGVSHRGLLDSAMSGRAGMSSGRSTYSTAGGSGTAISSSADSAFGSAPSRNFSDSIIVSNLDPSYTWQMLRDQCRRVGDVRFADMKGKGVGVVRFASAQEAQRAISLMDGQRLDGRVLDVRSY